MKNDKVTIAHCGENPDRYYNAVVPPVFLNSLHVFDSMEAYETRDENNTFVYGRNDNPTTHILEDKIAELEKGKRAIAFSSGMGAATAAILSVCHAGGHIICMRDVYQPVKSIINNLFVPNFKMSVSYWNGDSLEDLESMVQDNTELIILESPGTFVFTVVDLEGVAKIAHKHNIKTYIDNTYCTPLFQKPLTMGIDIVMHTMSKYIGGHSDIIGGVLVVNDEELGEYIHSTLRDWLGSIPGPMEAWLAIRGLRSMPARLEQHQKTAMQVAEFLENHTKVEKVYYSGLDSHPRAELIKKQQTGHTGLLSFVINGTPDEARQVVNKLKVFQIGCSWGGFESLALCPLIKSNKDELDFLGLREKDRGLIRIHCGLEGTDILIEDLRQALE